MSDTAAAPRPASEGPLARIAFFPVVLLLTLAPGGVWAALLSLNLRTGLGLPWAVPLSLALLWLAWRWAGGRPPWPRSPRRTAQRRANPVAAPVWFWALGANALALVALAGLWVLSRELAPVRTARLPDFAAYPQVSVALALGCAAIVGALAEEVGLRGYMQGRLEQMTNGPAAILIVALIAAPAHALTQGFVWPVFVFYLLADVVYGLTTYLTNSILPAALAHAAGLYIFFAWIWPRDAARPHLTLGALDGAFWTTAAVSGACAALCVLAFVGLARVTASLSPGRP